MLDFLFIIIISNWRSEVQESIGATVPNEINICENHEATGQNVNEIGMNVLRASQTDTAD